MAIFFGEFFYIVLYLQLIKHFIILVELIYYFLRILFDYLFVYLLLFEHA